jgi:hypothetical protein
MMKTMIARAEKRLPERHEMSANVDQQPTHFPPGWLIAQT